MSITESIMENLIREMGIVTEVTYYDDDAYNVSLDRNEGRYGYGSTYFKYYVRRHSKWFLARIILGKAEFVPVNHTNSKATTRGGKFVGVKNTTKLYDNEKEKLMEILKYPSINAECKDLGINTVYGEMLVYANRLAGVSYADMIKYRNSDPEKCTRPIIPIDLDIPNYTKL